MLMKVMKMSGVTTRLIILRTKQLYFKEKICTSQCALALKLQDSLILRQIYTTEVRGNLAPFCSAGE